jgi:DNA helicase HerA-like ATPase
MIVEKKIKLIFGKRGSGKSYLARKLIEDEQRLLIYDTMSEYNEGVIFGTENYEQFLTFWRQVYIHPFRLIYRPLRPDQEIENICRLVYALGNMTLLIEEVDCYAGTFNIADSLAHIIQRGRHKNIGLIGITQRPYGISRLLTSQAKEIYVFNTNEPRDREYLRQLLGQEIDAKLDQLQQYQYVKWQDGSDALEIDKA